MIKKAIVLHIMFIIVCSVGMNACSHSDSDVDLSGIDINMELGRYDQALFACRSVDQILELEKTFPVFHPVYMHNIMPTSGTSNTWTKADFAVDLYKYVSHPDMDSLYKLTQSKFGDFEKYKKELELAAKHINYYFSDERIERTYCFVSSFEFGSVYLEDDHAFAVGLDMYMGRDFEVYPLLDPSRFPSYRVKKFEPQYITPNAVKSFLYYKVKKNSAQSFLDEAIYEGKILYAMDKLLPRLEDSLKIAYLDGQLEWCIDNEVNIYAYLVEEEVLFSTDRNAYTNKFFNDGPFTTPFGNESAPRAGAWFGWQVVKAYMDKNPEISLEELLNTQDHQKIFRESKYKP
ncbi:MAG: hypothetical protein JXR19_08595 [Bacteroidia bacterium]